MTPDTIAEEATEMVFTAPSGAGDASSDESADTPKRAGRTPRRRRIVSAEAEAAPETEAPRADAGSGESADKQQTGESPESTDGWQDQTRGDSSGRTKRTTSTRRNVSRSRNDSGQQDQPRQQGQQKQDNRQQGRRQGQQKQQNRSDSHGARNNSGGRKPRRHHQGQYEQIEPQVTRDDIAAMKVVELKSRAAELGLVVKVGTKKDELVDMVFSAEIRAEGFVECEGVLDLFSEGYGFLRTRGYLPSENDVYVGVSTIRRNGLRKGDWISGQVRPARDNEKYAALQRIDTVNGLTVEESRQRCKFSELTPVYPDERLVLEHGADTITARTIDLVAPIGKGQRGLIVSPPKAGKTTILKEIAASITANNPDVHLMCLLVDERPEEVTDMERSIRGEVISSTFDMPSENHIAVSELVIERAKRLVETGRDVVILLDSITRLARAYNLAQPASGRVLSGGVDSTALYPPKRFLGAARNIENGGSLTILASALVETGSKMDEVIFEEFKGTGNMELKLDRDLADRRIFPAIDPISSGTRKEELLIDAQAAPLIWGLRRVLANLNNTERAMEMLIKSLKQTKTNAEFLMRTAKKANQGKNGSIDL